MSEFNYSDYCAEVQAVEAALKRLQNKAAAAPEDDWRAAILWEAAERALNRFGTDVFDATELPDKPAKFRHWRDRYVDRPPF